MLMGEIEALPDEVAERLADCNRNGLKSAKPTERERAVRALAKPEYRAHNQVLRTIAFTMVFLLLLQRRYPFGWWCDKYLNFKFDESCEACEN